MSHSLSDYLQQNRDRFEKELGEFLAIPSVSTESRHSKDVERCADWVAEHIRRAGVSSVEIIETGGKPIVVAEHIVNPDLPTLKGALYNGRFISVFPGVMSARMYLPRAVPIKNMAKATHRILTKLNRSPSAITLLISTLVLVIKVLKRPMASPNVGGASAMAELAPISRTIRANTIV